MLLYYCPVCGHWQDVSISKALYEFSANVARAFRMEPAVPISQYPCPGGHGVMVPVSHDDRISVRSALVESEELPDIAL